MNFESKTVLYFECDQRGRNTRFDGFKNSKKGYERPFLILSNKEYNEKSNNDGVYAIPLTNKGKGNNFSYTISDDTFENIDYNLKTNFKDSIILCDKICRLSRSDLSKFKSRKIVLRTNEFYQIRNKINSFINVTFTAY